MQLEGAGQEGLVSGMRSRPRVDSPREIPSFLRLEQKVGMRGIQAVHRRAREGHQSCRTES